MKNTQNRLYEAHVYHPEHGSDHLLILATGYAGAREELNRRLREEFPYPVSGWLIDYITPV